MPHINRSFTTSAMSATFVALVTSFLLSSPVSDNNNNYYYFNKVSTFAFGWKTCGHGYPRSNDPYVEVTYCYGNILGTRGFDSSSYTSNTNTPAVYNMSHNIFAPRGNEFWHITAPRNQDAATRPPMHVTVFNNTLTGSHGIVVRGSLPPNSFLFFRNNTIIDGYEQPGGRYSCISAGIMWAPWDDAMGQFAVLHNNTIFLIEMNNITVTKGPNYYNRRLIRPEIKSAAVGLGNFDAILYANSMFIVRQNYIYSGPLASGIYFGTYPNNMLDARKPTNRVVTLIGGHIAIEDNYITGPSNDDGAPIVLSNIYTREGFDASGRIYPASVSVTGNVVEVLSRIANPITLHMTDIIGPMDIRVDRNHLICRNGNATTGCDMLLRFTHLPTGIDPLNISVCKNFIQSFVSSASIQITDLSSYARSSQVNIDGNIIESNSLTPARPAHYIVGTTKFTESSATFERNTVRSPVIVENIVGDETNTTAELLTAAYERGPFFPIFLQRGSTDAMTGGEEMIGLSPFKISRLTIGNTTMKTMRQLRNIITHHTVRRMDLFYCMRCCPTMQTCDDTIRCDSSTFDSLQPWCD